MKKRIIAMILSIVMVIGMLPMTVFATDVVASGYCGGEGDGTNLTWGLDSTVTLATAITACDNISSEYRHRKHTDYHDYT